MTNNKTHKVTIRFTNEEFEKLQAQSKNAGMLKSEFIRSAIFSVNVIAKMTDEERKILRTLFGVATNLNQIAHKANAQVEFLTLSIELQNTRREIDAIIEKFNKK
ncbi:MAG: plasmid mobilization relaxosome protein MobC [Ferruginibacter sp.]|nr:plasmid mobilization relaxosome protein MobC [Ferruginibacter sp.]